jgi:hypothetical protein
MDATDEAILNSLFMADTTTGFRGDVRPACRLTGCDASARPAAY